MSVSGIGLAICKSASRSRQVTMPAPHHSVFLQARCPSCRPTNSVKALKALHTKTASSLASFQSRLVLHFWYWLTQVVVVVVVISYHDHHEIWHHSLIACLKRDSECLIACLIADLKCRNLQLLTSNLLLLLLIYLCPLYLIAVCHLMLVAQV